MLVVKGLELTWWCLWYYTSVAIGTGIGQGITGSGITVAIIGNVIVTRISSSTVMASGLVIVTSGSTVMMAEI